MEWEREALGEPICLQKPAAEGPVFRSPFQRTAGSLKRRATPRPVRKIQYARHPVEPRPPDSAEGANADSAGNHSHPFQPTSSVRPPRNLAPVIAVGGAHAARVVRKPLRRGPDPARAPQEMVNTNVDVAT